MKLDQFVALVSQMRSAQIDYFEKGRLHRDLIRSKQLERQVDQALREGVVLVDLRPAQEPIQKSLLPEASDEQQKE